MHSRFLALASIAALALPAAPATAQDYEVEHEVIHTAPVMDQGSYEGEWQGGWVSDSRYEGVWQGNYQALPHAPGLGYSTEERDAWLQRCRANYYREDVRRGPDGAFIGGVLGAVAGGIIGNRIDNRGSRLGGTLLGAGAGAVAGAVIGDAIDGEGDRVEEHEAYDYCESYLYDYERRGIHGMHHSAGYAGYGYGAVHWVRVPIHRVRRAACRCEPTVREVVEEEIIEEEVIVERPVVTTTVVREAPTPVKGKTQPLRNVK